MEEWNKRKQRNIKAHSQNANFFVIAVKLMCASGAHLKCTRIKIRRRPAWDALMPGCPDAARPVYNLSGGGGASFYSRDVCSKLAGSPQHRGRDMRQTYFEIINGDNAIFCILHCHFEQNVAYCQNLWCHLPDKQI